MKSPQATAQVARLFFDPLGAYTLRHKNGNTIYEDRTGAIHVEGVHHSRQQMENAMFHPQSPARFQEFSRN